MYNILLTFHSWARWLVLIFALIAIIKAFKGWQNKEAFLKEDSTFGGLYIGFVHLQVLLGLILYFFLSPVTDVAFSDFGSAMKNSTLRFWAVEHITGMIIAAIVAQVGRIKSKKAVNDIQKHKKAFIFYTISLILILISMPYIMRPLFRI